MEQGLHLGVPNAAYHADRKAVSSTWLKLVDSHSPFHLRSYLDSPPAEPTPALVMGSAVDCLIFEPEEFSKQFIVHPAVNRRTNAGKEEWAKLTSKSAKTKKYLISEEKKDEALKTAEAVRNNPVMSDFLKRGVAQPVFVWRDPVTGLLCKCKLDWYDEETGTVVDLKTAQDASPYAFSKAVANYGYHIQSAFYSDGVRMVGKPCKRFIFGVIEKPDNRNTFEAAPELMAFYELDAADEDAGRDAYSSSLAAINFCMTNDEWAGYTNDIQVIKRPGWARKNDTESLVGL